MVLKWRSRLSNHADASKSSWVGSAAKAGAIAALVGLAVFAAAVTNKQAGPHRYCPRGPGR